MTQGTQQFIGQLVYGDVTGVEDPDILDNSGEVLLAIRNACTQGGATVMRTLAHRFQPRGLTALAVLAESHVAVHTYPEHASYALDVFTCGRSADPMAIASAIIRSLGGGQPQLRLVRRGRDGQDWKTDRADAGAG